MNAETAVILAKDPPPQVALAMKQAEAMGATAQAMVIDSPAMYEAAADELRDVRTRWKAVEAQRVHLKEPYLEGSRRIDEFFRAPLDRLSGVGELLKAGMVAYKDAEDAKAEAAMQAEKQRQADERAEQEKLQREAQQRQEDARLESERQQREAQERADAERARLQAIADEAAAAGNAEAAEAAQAEAKAAQEAADREAEQARAQAAAVALESQQAAEAAQQAMDEADVAPVAALVVSGARAAGVSGRKTWKLKTVDKGALVTAAAQALVNGDDSLLAYLAVNEKVLNGIARSLEGAARVPGCTFGPVTSIAARSK